MIAPEILRTLAPNGILRAAINFGNPVLAQPGDDGQPRGVSVDLARELARRLGTALDFVPFDAAGKVVDALARDAWDIAFLAIDPVRAAGIMFTPPYVMIEGTYIVREDSSLRAIEDFDRQGLRISVGRGAAYDLFLTRALKAAELVRAETSARAVEMFVARKLDAAAGVRQPLEAFARDHAGFRVIDGRFTAIEQAMATPKGRDAGWCFLCDFVEDMKHSGFVAEALRRSGQTQAAVAPPAAVAEPSAR